MVNRIVLNETSYHGAGAIQEIATEVTKRGFKKAFVCSDPDLVKFGVTKKVTDVLDNAGLAYEVYSQIKPNPTIENVQTGVAAFKAAGADYLIAIGGGSSMDTAKAVGIIINNPEFEDVRSLEGVADTKKPCVPIIAVPTTAGTAAEVTINYVITDVEKKRKFVCVDPHDIPVIAVIDPEMMSSMPERLKEAFHFGTQAATVMMIGGTCLLLFLPKQILFLFAASESMIKIGVPAMRILSIGLVFCGFSIMIATYQQAIEKIQSSMLIHILRQGILLVPLMWLFNHMFGINGIWISFPVTEILVFIVAVLLQTVIPKPQ